MKDEISPEDLKQCLEAISCIPKGASEIRRTPGEIYSSATPDGRYIYINFINPSEIPIGSTYRTWIVRFKGNRLEGVSYFRSRRGELGDDTLPPEDDVL